MLESEKLAIAARLHVLLRRKTGRVTDTEWMACNAEYATEIVRFCRSRATEPGFEDILEWAARLEQAVAGQGSSRRTAPVDLTATQPLTPEADFANSTWAESTIGMMRAVLAQHGLPAAPVAASPNLDSNRYVGRLR